MTITLKQAEAFYWIATLGSVVEAAERLNLAQSTLSKRLAELEAVVGMTLFDRRNRTVRLTRIGENLVPVAASMLKLEARFREIAVGSSIFRGPFRFGVTELVALSWLPKLIVAMKEAYPEIVPEPEVEASVVLFNKLADHRLDLVIALNPPSGSQFTAVPLDSVDLQWMCAPDFGPKGDIVPAADIAAYPILTQTEGSGLHELVFNWLSGGDIKLNRVVKCNSLNVLAALAAAGLGITVLTDQYFRPEITSGRLRVIKTTPKIPAVQYFAAFRSDGLDPLVEHIAELARTCCDFDVT